MNIAGVLALVMVFLVIVLLRIVARSAYEEGYLDGQEDMRRMSSQHPTRSFWPSQPKSRPYDRECER